jgi:hypothetical protein
MSKIKVYRYDDQEFSNGHVMESRGDSFDILTDYEKMVEVAIRAALPDGTNVRGTSLYTWEDEKLAKRLWGLSKKKYHGKNSVAAVVVGARMEGRADFDRELPELLNDV